MFPGPQNYFSLYYERTIKQETKKKFNVGSSRMRNTLFAAIGKAKT